MQEARAALKFDLTSIPQNAEILEATLEIYRSGSVFGDNNTWDNPTTYEIRTINDSWSNAGNTDANTLFDNWDSFGSSYDSDLIASAEYTPAEKGWFSFDVVSAVKTMVESQETNHGFMLFSNGYVKSGNGGSLSKFVSGDGTPTTNRPKLTIIYDPGTPIAKQESSFTSKAELTFDKGPVQITVVNASGRQLLSKKLSNDSQLNQIKEDLQKGIYFVQFTISGQAIPVEKWFIGK